MVDDPAGGEFARSVRDLADGPAPTGTSHPLVSVCIPLYCKEAFIGETIQSVLDQTFTEFELVVLENASSD